jgi:nitrite reductase/ring-hydroxylating ferredoxin subunit
MDACAWQPIVGIDVADAAFPAAGTIGDADVVVFRTATGYRASARACPHQYADMLVATLTDEDATLRCPIHGFTFRLADGRGVNCPGFVLKVYEVIERDGALLARPVG